ncbi:MAG: Gfo/Idh/MocA family oxidoreductase [Nitrospirae bacterium]|nr:Gfo/Idh/MocA family oxidoreductase [Nitrospirota bacterium]
MSNIFDKKKLNILVIGTGMYVCGRGTDSYGTILPAIYEWKKSGFKGDVYIAGTRPDGVHAVREKAAALDKLYGFAVNINYYPQNKANDPEAYKKAINDIPKPACAIVAVPDDLHRTVAGHAVENGLHTLVVKPIAPTLKETLELIELQERHNVYCSVEFHKRFDRSNLRLKDAISSGKIGEPLYFIVEYSQRKSIPTEKFKKWVETTNIFQYLGIHYADIIYWATGAVPLRVMAAGQKNFLVSRGIDVYDAIQAVVEWKAASGNIFTSSFFTNWIDPENTSAMSDQRIKVIGTKGRYEADQKNRGIRIVTDDNGIEEPNPDFCSMYGTAAGDMSFRGYGIESVLQFLADVCGIESGTLNIAGLEGRRPTFKDSIIPTAIIEAVNKSLAENGKWINVKSNHGKSITLE